MPSQLPPQSSRFEPPSNLNEAWDQNNDFDSASSLYDNPTTEEPIERNPFSLPLHLHSSFKPLGPQPSPPESIPMIQKPVARVDQSTMTALSTLERNAIQAKSVRARWAESLEHLERVQFQLNRATLSHLDQAGCYEGPTRQLPPLPPTRTSSLRRETSRQKKRNRQRKSMGSTEPLPTTNTTD